jgi:CBS domain-containing protein
MPAVIDVVEFLRRHPPFDTLGDAELETVAALTEIAFYPAGHTVFAQGDGPVPFMGVVRSGSVELIYDGQLLDLLGEGELFGQASMMSGLPIGFSARLAEDTLLYQVPTEAMVPLLSRPRAMRFLLRSVIVDPIPGAGERPPVVDPLQRRAGALIRMPLVACDPGEPIRAVAATMTDRNASAVIVVGAAGLLGIVTDTDLRSKVVAVGLDPSAPVRTVMTAPVHTISAGRLGGDALVEMVELGVRHLPVVGASGTVLGVLEDIDLVSMQTRTPFVLRRQIARAKNEDEVVAAAGGLRPAVIALRRGGAGAAQISAVWSVVLDALVRALIVRAEAARRADVGADLGGAEPDFTWLALGSLARREATPSSDVDSALSWAGTGDDPEDRAYLARITAAVAVGLAAGGLAPDEHRVSASDPLFARPLASWDTAAAHLVTHPYEEKAPLIASVLLDCRPVWGDETWQSVTGRLVAGAGESGMLRAMLRIALAHHLPTGFFRDFVVESGGQRRGLLDLKRGGILPIVDLARWAGLAAGVGSASTSQRLEAAAAAGVLNTADAKTLLEAFDVVREVRMSHQIEQLEAGEPADDFIRPAWLSSIGRAQLKEAFRAVAGVQRGLAAELQIGAL